MVILPPPPVPFPVLRPHSRALGRSRNGPWRWSYSPQLTRPFLVALSLVHRARTGPPPDAEVLISFRFEPTAPIGLAAWRTHSPPLPVHSPPLMQGHDVETLGNRASQLASAVYPGTRCPFSVFRTVLRNGLYLQSSTDACLAPTHSSHSNTDALRYLSPPSHAGSRRERYVSGSLKASIRLHRNLKPHALTSIAQDLLSNRLSCRPTPLLSPPRWPRITGIPMGWPWTSRQGLQPVK